MECLRATEIISATHDGEMLDAAVVAEARAHCDGCLSCAEFIATLERMDALPVPRAPEALVARLLEEAAAEAAYVRARGPEVSPDGADTGVRRFLPAWLATPRASALAAATAVLLLAIGVGTVGLLDSYSGRVGADDAQLATESDRAGQEDFGAEKPQEEMVGTTAPSDVAMAPSYIALEGAVWVLRGTGEVDESVLTTAGTVTTDLGTGSPASRPAYHVGTDGSILWLRDGDSGFVWFERVTRTLGRRLYGLMTGSVLALFGEWPSLPDRFAPPDSSDGAPSFRFFGSDDLGVDVYVPVDGTAEDGIAVPPDQAPDDPASGNPQWTWWEPVR